LMRCRSARELQAYLDHELSLPRREAMRRHLQDCVHCRSELAGLQQVERLLGQVRPPTPPSHLLPATLQRLRATAAVPLPVALWRRAPALATVAAAAAVLVVSLHAARMDSPSSAPMLGTVSAPEVVGPAAVIVPAGAPQHAVSIKPAAAARTAVVRSPRRAARFGTPKVSTKAAAVATKSAVADAQAHAAAAYNAVKRRADEGDPDLMVAALENVALAYPGTAGAAEALLTAADLQRKRGNLTEADAAYRRVLAQRSGGALPQALAHKALADLRTQTVGDDEVARYHYQEATRVLRRHAGTAKAPGSALLVMGDIARATGDREEAVADYATVANQATGEQALACLAEVL
jgi:predicted negative regulator of RcsB-dependent stress response